MSTPTSTSTSPASPSILNPATGIALSVVLSLIVAALVVGRKEATLDAELRDAQRSIARLEEGQREAKARHESDAARLAAMEVRLAGMDAKVDGLGSKVDQILYFVGPATGPNPRPATYRQSR